MKAHSVLLVLILLSSCSHITKDLALEKLDSQLQGFIAKEQLEIETRAGIERYISELNSADWREKLEQRPYSKSVEEQRQFHEWYQAFRDAYQNMKLNIKHLAIEGNEAILWLEITCVHSGKTEDVISDITPSGKPIYWQEVWYFDMDKDKFGDKWDLLVRELDKMNSVGATSIPDGYFDSH